MSPPLDITIRGPGRCPECAAALDPAGSCPACGYRTPTLEQEPEPADASPAASSPPLDPQGNAATDDGHHLPPGESPRWLDHPENVRKLIRIFWVLCALLISIDLLALVGLYQRDTHFAWERFPGFYGLYGLGACVALVLLAKQLRKVVMRGEDYYESS